MPGPPPKPASQRARRNKDTIPTTILRFVKADQPALPKVKGIVWCKRTRDWWAMWATSAQADHFSATDWDFLLDTALLHNDIWGYGNLDRLPELRIRVAKFGATPEDRARLRMQFAEADTLDSKRPKEADEKPGGVHEMYPGLRAVDGGKKPRKKAQGAV